MNPTAPSIVETVEKGVWVVMPSGRLDPQGGPELEKYCLPRIEAGTRKLLLDLREVVFLSSAGLRSILSLVKALDKSGGHLVLCAMPPMVLRVFRAAGFDTFLKFAPTREEALALFPAEKAD